MTIPSRSPGVARSGRRVLAPLALLGSFALAYPAGAQIVTHTYTGTVESVTNGTGSTLDLTGTFSIGQIITIATTVDRGTAPSTQDAFTATYIGAVTQSGFTLGSYVCTGDLTNNCAVTNDLPSGPLGTAAHAAVTDEYQVALGALVAPSIGNAFPSQLLLTLVDNDATAFNSTAPPGVMPPITDFETRTFTLLFVDPVLSRTGLVGGTLTDVTTPAHPSSWGRVKALYRD